MLPSFTGAFDCAMRDKFNDALLKHPIIVACFLGVLTLTVFSPSFSYDFVNYDDNAYVYENPTVLHGLSWEGVQYAFTTGDNATWAPLTWLSYELDTTLLGTRASSYHITNVVLHTAAGVVLFFALYGMLRSIWVSTFVAGVFLLHPLRVESVVWVSERKDVLCALFWALGLLSYWHYARKSNVGRGMLVLACFILGALSKMMMVTFPFVLLLLDVWPLKRVTLDKSDLRAKAWSLFLEKIPVFVLCGLVVFLNTRALNAMETLNPSHTSFPAKCLRVFENYGFYLQKIFWPDKLSILYPIQTVSALAAAFCGVLLAAITLVAVLQRQKCPWLLVGWLWFVVTLVPVIGFVTFGHFFVSNRYAYIPSIGLTLAVAVSAENLAKQFSKSRWIATGGVILLCALATRANLPRWQNSLTLFEDSVSKGPHEVAYNNLAVAYKNRSDLDKAITACDKAIAIYPNYPEAFDNRGLAYDEKGEYAVALTNFNRALELATNSASIFNNRGATYLHIGNKQHALEDFSEAIKLRPNYATALSNRGAVELDLGNFEASIRDCAAAVKCDSSLAGAWSNLGNALSYSGNLDGAMDSYNRAIALRPENANFYNNRAAIFFRSKKYVQAKTDLEKCRELGGQPHPGLVHDLNAAINGESAKK